MSKVSCLRRGSYISPSPHADPCLAAYRGQKGVAEARSVNLVAVRAYLTGMRAFFSVLLAFSVGTGVLAQTRPQGEPPPSSVTQVPPALESDARLVREQLRELMLRYPPDLGRILKMDPTMVSNAEYLSQYPALSQFLTAHPEIVRNPNFYFDFVRLSSDYTEPPTDASGRAFQLWRGFIEAAGVFIIVVFISMMIAWLVKTFLTHRKWLRTSKVQTEVHNKLLDRFAGTDELLTYVQTPAGKRFLEASPIPIDGPIDRAIAPPLNRILWSIQAGIVLVVGGLGFQYVSRNVIDEVSQGLWTIGVLATAFGLGFIIAGLFSYVMSRRLGLFEPAAPIGATPRGDQTAG